MLFEIPPEPRGEDKITPVLTDLIDKALVDHSRAEYAKGRGSGVGQVAYNRIGSGYIGLPCARELAYKYHKAPKEEKEVEYVTAGELQRHAEVGHWAEANTAKWMRLAGFQLLTEKSDGKQFGYVSAPDPISGQYRIAGELDGVITRSPTPLIPTPCLWESKKATMSKYKKFVNNGVQKEDPKYYGQLQTNMLEMQVQVTLFTMLNVNDMTYYFELVEFDPKEAQWLQDRAANVLASSRPEELPRIAATSTDFRCKFCDYQKTCWQKPVKAAVTTPAVPFWAQKK